MKKIIIILFVFCINNIYGQNNYNPVFDYSPKVIDTKTANFDFEKILFLFSPRRKVIEFFPEITLKENHQLYYVDSNYIPHQISNAFLKGKVKVIAKIPSYYKMNKSYILVKSENEKSWWTGYIELDKSIPIGDHDARIFAYDNNETFIQLLNTNDYLVIKTSLEEDSIVYIMKRTDREIIKLCYSDIKKYFPSAYDFYVLSNSYNGKYIWFRSDRGNMFPEADCFIVYNTQLEKYTLLKTPYNFGNNEYIINFNTGEIMYSDYPFQIASDMGYIYPEENKVYRLYRGNLFLNKYTLLSENNSFGFDIRYENGILIYKQKKKK